MNPSGSSKNRSFVFFALLLYSLAPSQLPAQPIEVDVLVVNGGAGGVAAGLQAARSGARTLIVEPTPWLGGMLTAAGVSATDGNHRMPAGIWGEFRSRLWAHYGGKAAVETGWVSNTLFEPHVGARIFQEMAGQEKQLELWFQSQLISVKKTGQGWTARINRNGSSQTVTARILVDATDLGDIAARVGAGFDVGMEAAAATGESFAPKTANDIIQDLTLVAVLKDYGKGSDKTIPRPAGYDPAEFRCACREVCPDSSGTPCAQMLSYGKLPGNKYMLNWPNAGNDFYANTIGKSPKAVRKAIDSARLHTLRYVYFIQHELGYRHLGLADDEFPTPDRLAFYPYYREGRRIHGLVRVNAGHILDPFQKTLYRSSAIVGDYPIDHHHKKYPAAPDIEFPPVPSFNIPLGALIPKDVEGLLVADKAISVSNIVNGSSRLQPVVLQIGQAAGAMAAMAVRKGIPPSQLSVRSVQAELLAAGAWLMPFFDVPAEDPHFASIQRIGATGILRGRGEAYQWANRTWFDPEKPVLRETLREALASLPIRLDCPGQTEQVLVRDAIQLAADFLEAADKAALPAKVAQDWASWGLSSFDPARPITRRELAVLLDRSAHLFSRWEVDWAGNWKP